MDTKPAMHTPGPGPFTLGDIDADLGGGVNSETKALYRAAPDLLEAAKYLERYLDGELFSIGASITGEDLTMDQRAELEVSAREIQTDLVKVRAAIAKAEGR